MHPMEMVGAILMAWVIIDIVETLFGERKF
jgi:hypothetical protein